MFTVKAHFGQFPSDILVVSAERVLIEHRWTKDGYPVTIVNCVGMKGCESNNFFVGNYGVALRYAGKRVEPEMEEFIVNIMNDADDHIQWENVMLHRKVVVFNEHGTAIETHNASRIEKDDLGVMPRDLTQSPGGDASDGEEKQEA